LEKCTVSEFESSATKASSLPQFFNENGYSIGTAAGRPSRFGQQGRKRHTAAAILSEAARVAGFCDHVENPSPPKTLFGTGPSQLLSWLSSELEPAALSQRVSTAKYGLRRQRSDTPVMIAAVASYPGPPDDADPKYVAWRVAVVAWAKRNYGGYLQSVLEHVDEKFGHVHIIASRGGQSVKPIMAGHKAASLAQSAGASKEAQGKAYKSGGQALQDAFWKGVGEPCGLSRMSPTPRPRRSRAAHLNSTKALLEREANELELRRRDMEAKAMAIALADEEVAQRAKDMTAAETASDARIAEASRRNAGETERLKLQLEAFTSLQTGWLAVLADAVPDRDARVELLRRHGLRKG